jgi:hypothetical protein
MPRLIVPLPFFVTNVRWMLWLRFEKGFPRYVSGFDLPKAVVEHRLTTAREELAAAELKAGAALRPEARISAARASA